MSTPFRVKAVYEYASAHEDDLSFSIGQIITVVEEEDTDWYGGEYVDDAGVKHEGMFPRNFVEKFEPTAPPRPIRTRTNKTADAPAAPVTSPEEPPLQSPLSPKETGPKPQESAAREVPAASPTISSAPIASVSKPAAPVPIVSSPPAVPAVTEEAGPSSPPTTRAPPAQKKPGGPAPPAEKPTTDSFRDRIAAFNKPAAPPVAPFKPGGLSQGGVGFIKKPYVAPPPSKNAYVPPPRDVPVAKIYRRDEDPEIKEREAENQESAEKAGLVPGATANDGDDEDQPKPLSLKERMALLQKQQVDQAQRHADAAAKKEKPKRPPKKRLVSQEGPADGADLAYPPPLERRDTEETGNRTSLEESQPPRMPHPPRRKSSKGPVAEDGNEADMSGAGDTTEGQEDEETEKEDSDEKTRNTPRVAGGVPPPAADGEEDEEDEEDEDEDDDEDPEIRRKEELRQRMAKMSGGMGMYGMFGPPGLMPMSGGAPAPPKKKKPQTAERRPSEPADEGPSPSTQAPPVPTMMALPGMSVRRSEEKTPSREDARFAPGDGDEEDEEEEEEAGPPPRTPSLPKSSGGAPPIPAGRPAPPPVPGESRPPPVPPSAAVVKSQSEGSASDDELSEHTSQETPGAVSGPVGRAPPPPPVNVPPPAMPTSPRLPGSAKRTHTGGEASPSSPSVPAPSTPGKRASRQPPPIPGAAPALPPAQNRPPPPPPPGAALSRQSTTEKRPLSPSRAFAHEDDEGEEEEVTEYEGDYDTDIASSAPHKDALKAHARESSVEDTGPPRLPVAAEAPASLPPPVPSASRAPPRIPTQPPPDRRQSSDVPRVAPPPPPPPKETPRQDEDYDPFSYSSSGSKGVPMPGFPPPGPKTPSGLDDTYSPPDLTLSFGAPPPNRPPLAPPPGQRPRQSQDAGRSAPKRSMDVNRPSTESGFVAHDLDLASHTGWWLQPNSIPPQLQGRTFFFESEESSGKRGGKTEVTRDIYVLYQDYSQTIITVRFDPTGASSAHLEQRHEAPPRSLRQDQLEESYERFGRAIAEAVATRKDMVVGDGTPQALVYELLRPHKDALLPVGMRAYGALVYANLANASTTQNDEIRAGDVMSVRNARFQGKHGAMHAKYSAEVGKPDHVAVVAEWDGTKKKVRAWEQGRESKKVRLESFKLDDLRSGEVKIWRVMPRSWVGWEGLN